MRTDLTCYVGGSVDYFVGMNFRKDIPEPMPLSTTVRFSLEGPRRKRTTITMFPKA